MNVWVNVVNKIAPSLKLYIMMSWHSLHPFQISQVAFFTPSVYGSLQLFISAHGQNSQTFPNSDCFEGISADLSLATSTQRKIGPLEMTQAEAAMGGVMSDMFVKPGTLLMSLSRYARFLFLLINDLELACIHEIC